MVTFREYLVITTGNRKPRPDLGIGKRTAKRDKTSCDPGYEKNCRIDRGISGIRRSSKYTHAYHKSHRDHGEIKQSQFWFTTHGLKIQRKGSNFNVLHFLRKCNVD